MQRRCCPRHAADAAVLLSREHAISRGIYQRVLRTQQGNTFVDAGTQGYSAYPPLCARKVTRNAAVPTRLREQPQCAREPIHYHQRYKRQKAVVLLLRHCGQDNDERHIANGPRCQRRSRPFERKRTETLRRRSTVHSFVFVHTPSTQPSSLILAQHFRCFGTATYRLHHCPP